MGHEAYAFHTHVQEGNKRERKRESERNLFSIYMRMRACQAGQHAEDPVLDRPACDLFTNMQQAWTLPKTNPLKQKSPEAIFLRKYLFSS